MSALEKLIDPVTDQLKERLNSPFIYSFIISWCIWNYRFLIVLFSDATVLQTFQLIDNVIYPNIIILLGKGFLAPFISTLIYVFGYPYPAKLIYSFVRKKQRELLEIARQIDNETPLTKEESKKVRLEMAALEEELNAKIFNKNLQINQLASELNQLKKETNTVNVKVSGIGEDEEISETQYSLLELIDNLKENATHKNLLTMSKQIDLRTEYDLEALIRKNYIVKKFDQTKDDEIYKFTQLGREVTLPRVEIPF
jgi:hypothetical protein